MRRAGLACLVLWTFALCLASSPLWAWSLQRIDTLPPPVAQHLQATADDHSGRDVRHYYRLHGGAGAQDRRMLLVLERDRGQRLWLYTSAGVLLGQLPLGAAPGPVSVGSLVGLPQTPDPHRWVLFACMLQGIAWAVALGDRALSLQRERERAWALAERLRERTSSTPVQAHGLQHRMTVSIGIAPLDRVAAQVALANADRAMYRAKAAGRDRVEMA